MSEKPHAYYLPKGGHPDKSSRGGKAKHAGERWCIEGENLTIKEISLRSRLHEDTVRRKLKILRTKPDAITWASLRQRSIK